MRLKRSNAFTLVEVMIVVIIIGVLAAIVIPQFSNASQSARENTLKDDLRFLRNQSLTYKILHGDVAPGYDNGNFNGNASEASYVAQMTLYTDAQGNTSAIQTDVFKNGPYLAKVPENPINHLNTIMVLQNNDAVPAQAS